MTEQRDSNCSSRKLQTDLSVLFISLITRMRYKRDIKMGRLCTPGGCSHRNCRWGCDVPFFLIVRLFLTKICYFGYVCTLLWLS